MLRRRCVFARLEAWDFACSERLIDTEWQRRLNEQSTLGAELQALKMEVQDHFGQRYRGESFEEWLRHLFQTPMTQLREYSALCSKKLAALQNPVLQKVIDLHP